MHNLKVTITARAVDLNESARNLEEQPVTLKLEIVPDADSYAQAIVRGLRHGADTAAARLGQLDEIHAPELIDEVIGFLVGKDKAQAGCDKQDSAYRYYAEALAAEYGLKLRDG